MGRWVGGALLVVFAMLEAPSAIALPSVRIVEIGHGRTVYSGGALSAEAEVSAPEAFRGRLDTELWWAEILIEGPLRSAGLRSAAEVAVEPGGRQRLRLWFPTGMPNLPSQSMSQVPREVALDWTLRDASGRTVAHGSERIELEDDPAGPLVLDFGPAPKARERFVPLGHVLVPRPADAPPERAEDYADHAIVLVRAADLARWAPAARQALVDAVALFRLRLVITGAADLAAVPAPLARALAAPDALLWRGEDGAEAREVSFLGGVVRTTTRSGDAAPFDPRTEGDPLYELLTRRAPTAAYPEMKLIGPPGPLRQDPAGRAVTGPVLRVDDDGQSTADRWLASAVDRLRGIAVLPALVALVLLAILLRTSAVRRPASRRAARFVVPAVVVALGAVFTVRASDPLPGLDATYRVAYHDAIGTIERTWIIRGGGGRAPEPLTIDDDPRAASFAFRPWRNYGNPYELLDTLLVVRDREGRRRLGLDRAGPARSQIVVAKHARASALDPPFEARLRRDAEHLAGELEARRALRAAAVIHPGGLVWLGALRAGEKVDLARLARASTVAVAAEVRLSTPEARLFERLALQPWLPWNPSRAPDGDALLADLAALPQCPVSVWRARRPLATLCPDPWSVIAEEEEVTPVPGLAEGGRPLVARRAHVQRLIAPGPAGRVHFRPLVRGEPAGYLLPGALAERAGASYHIAALEQHPGCELPLDAAATAERGALRKQGERDGFVQLAVVPPYCAAEGSGEDRVRLERSPR